MTLRLLATKSREGLMTNSKRIPRAGRSCSYPKCGKPLQSSEWCQGHHLQVKRGESLRPLRQYQKRHGVIWLCTGPSCGRVATAQDLCEAHAKQRRKGHALQPLRGARSTCIGPACDKLAHARGMCSGHWCQWSKGEQLSPLRRFVRVQDGKKYCAGCDKTKSIDEFCKKLDSIGARCRVCQRRSHRMKKYGLTLEEAIAVENATHCDCCGSTEFGPKGPMVDHHHESGAVRGIVCGWCNSTVGFSKEDADRLRAVVAYLDRHR